MVNFVHQPAPPILALYLLDPEHFDLDDFCSADHDPGTDLEDAPRLSLLLEQRLATSCGCIDDALAGGFSYGQINSLAADSTDVSVVRTLVRNPRHLEYRNQSNHNRSR